MQVYKQKLKHVLLEQQSANTGLQTDAAITRSLVQKRNADTELRLQNDAHNLQADYREKKLHNENLLKELKLVSLDSWSSDSWWLVLFNLLHHLLVFFLLFTTFCSSFLILLLFFCLHYLLLFLVLLLMFRRRNIRRRMFCSLVSRI